MKTVLSTTSRLYRGARHPVLYGLFAFAWIGASTATAQSGGALVQRLDSIAGAGVRENRAVGIVAAVVKGNDALLLKAYGKAVVESDSPATADAVAQLQNRRSSELLGVGAHLEHPGGDHFILKRQ